MVTTATAHEQPDTPTGHVLPRKTQGYVPSPESGEDPPGGVSLAKTLFIIFLARTSINTAHRIIYPFLPSIARGLGISLVSANMLITLRLVAGMVAPLVGPLVDRSRRRRVMELALGLFTLASLLLAGGGSFFLAAIAFILYGLTKTLYDPTIQAYLGDTVPYIKRARAIGIVELSWSSAWLVGVPAAGFLIEHIGWRAPWAVLAGVGVASMVLTHTALPPGPRKRQAAEGAPLGPMLLQSWQSLLQRRQVLNLLSISFLMVMAQEITFIMYGAWLERSFGLSLSTLGLASIVVGLAEAAAEMGTTLFTDRLGTRRSVLIGLLGLAASLLLLPWLAGIGLAPALLGVVLMMLTFEFAIVSLLPLATELAPEARATLLSLNGTAFSLGRILGAFAGGLLWQWYADGIRLNALVGAVCALIAAVLTVRGMVDIKTEQ